MSSDLYVNSGMVKSPLQYTLVRNMSCLDPHLLISDQDLCVKKMNKVLQTLVDARHVEKADCDDILCQG